MKLPHLPPLTRYYPIVSVISSIGLVISIMLFFFTTGNLQKKNNELENGQKKALADLLSLKKQDQYKINQQLTSEITKIHSDYKKTVQVYQDLLDLKAEGSQIKDTDTEFAETLSYLSEKNYASAEARLILLQKSIADERVKLAQNVSAGSSQTPPPVNNTPPAAGFSQQSVKSDIGDFVVDIVSADLGSTRVIVDTASDSDCHDGCPTLPLADYVARNGAFAGINGTFFCPAEYPSCAGKTNSFDTLLMNKNKHYFNSDNNIYSTVPLVYFSGNSMGVRNASSNWGRTTDVDSVIAMQPLLVQDGNILFGSSGDAKINSRGMKGFIGNKGSTVYIGFVHNATMSDSAHVLKTLGLQNAINLDEGGSTALWYGGYKAGPGRNIPNAVLFIRK